VAVLSEEVRRVLGELEGLKRGTLRVSASSTPGLYWLPDILAGYARRYPAIQLTLQLGNSAEVVGHVLAGDADLGFVGITPAVPGLQIRPFAQDEIVLIAPSGHSLGRRTTYASNMLAGETLILREAGSGTRQLVEAHLAQLALAPGRVMEIEGSEGVKRAVGAGLGVGFVSRRALALEVAQGVLQVAEIPEMRIARPLSVLSRKDARPSAATLAFLALLVKGRGSAGLTQGKHGHLSG
jgi:DNA-binding transcriptional LysR family regulator